MDQQKNLRQLSVDFKHNKTGTQVKPTQNNSFPANTQRRPTPLGELRMTPTEREKYRDE